MLKLRLRCGGQHPEKNPISKQNLRDTTAKFKKELQMNAGSEKANIEIEQDTILNKTNK